MNEPAWGSQEQWEGEHIKKLEDQVRKEQNPSALDLDYDPELFEHDDNDYK